MKKLMSLKTRKELLASVRDSYLKASWVDKGKILDGFVAATDYDRKYAIQILNAETLPDQDRSRRSVKKYDDQVRLSLITLWNAANKICSKRLVPFLPELISVMETKGHLRLPSDVRDKLSRNQDSITPEIWLSVGTAT